MFSDPQTVSLDNGTSPVVLTRKGTTNQAALGQFKADSGWLTLDIRQKSTRGRKRHEAVITLKKVATDPLTAVLSEVSMSVGFYVDQPKVGFTDAERVDVANALELWMNAAGNVSKLSNGDT